MGKALLFFLGVLWVYAVGDNANSGMKIQKKDGTERPVTKRFVIQNL